MVVSKRETSRPVLWGWWVSRGAKAGAEATSHGPKVSKIGNNEDIVKPVKNRKWNEFRSVSKCIISAIFSKCSWHCLDCFALEVHFFPKRTASNSRPGSGPDQSHKIMYKGFI